MPPGRETSCKKKNNRDMESKSHVGELNLCQYLLENKKKNTNEDSKKECHSFSSITNSVTKNGIENCTNSLKFNLAECDKGELFFELLM